MPLPLLRVGPLAALFVVACGSATPSQNAGAAATQATSPATPAASTATTTTAPSDASSAAVLGVPPPPSPQLLAEIQKGIVQRSPTSFDIARATLTKIFENQPALMSQARIVPETDKGKVLGARVFGVGADSFLGALGIQNGDRVERIDGTDMSTPDKVVATVAALRKADHFTVVLNRGGQDVSIDYTVK